MNLSLLVLLLVLLFLNRIGERRYEREQKHGHE
jgi:hypothetical protein